MRRKIDALLDGWAASDGGSPLLVRGARRVGKTYAVRALGERRFPGRFVYCDFQADLERLGQVFDGVTDVARIVGSLELLSGTRIERGSTLVALDEVQLCEKALNSLRFFAGSGYRVVATGSQLGLALGRRELPFPSDVRHVHLRPMDFEEFLWALGQEGMSDGIRRAFGSRSAFLLHDEALRRYRDYVVVGGMPAAVAAFAEGGDHAAARDRQAEILETYAADIALYAPAPEAARAQSVWRSIPKQIARETSRKFRWADVAKGGRESQYRGPLAWLEAAELVLLTEQTNDTAAPLMGRGGGSFFKVYMADVGLLYRRLGLDPQAYLVDATREALSGRFTGALAENHVAQALAANGLSPYYWVPKSGGQAEVEFVLQDGRGRVVPVEVKAGTSVASSSLERYRKKSGSPAAIRVSARNLGEAGGLLSVPLYAAFCLDAGALASL